MDINWSKKDVSKLLSGSVYILIVRLNSEKINTYISNKHLHIQCNSIALFCISTVMRPAGLNIPDIPHYTVPAVSHISKFRMEL